MDKENIKKLKEEALPKQELDAESELPSPKWWERVLEIIRRHSTRRNLVILGVVLAVIIIGVLLRVFVFKPAPKQLYAVAVVVRSQSNKNDPVEDARSSLKAGDVLLVTDPDHKWSKTESISYLMLKMNLTEDQKQKLTQGEEREIPDSELSDEEKQRIADEKKQAKDEGRDYQPEPRTETLRAREYHIDLTKKPFTDFKAIDLMNGQPFADQTFDWGIVSKKKSVLKEK